MYFVFPGGSVVKILPANGGDARELPSIPGLGRSPAIEVATHSNILAWKIPWTEGFAKESDTTEYRTNIFVTTVIGNSYTL